MPSPPKETRRCAARGCPLSVPPRVLMCRRHWFMVPTEIRHRVWNHYRPGQETDHAPSGLYLYLKAMLEAVDAVAYKESKKETGLLHEWHTFAGIQCCKKCGVVENDYNADKHTCPGTVKVRPRQGELPT